MNQTDFINLIKAPQYINTLQTDALKDVIEAFPYFQSAKALYLKGLKNAESYQYNTALKTTAAYTTDRSILFDFITSEVFSQNEISQFITQNTSYLEDIEVEVEDISVNKKRTIDAILKQQIEDAKNTFDPEFFQPKTKQEEPVKTKNKPVIPEATLEAKEQTATPEVVLNIGKPLQFNKSETHSFNEWLSLSRFSPISREEEHQEATIKTPSKKVKNEDTKSAIAKAKKFELIEEFIEKSPKLVAKKTPISTKNIAKDQMIQPEALMTETLARIYLEQKNYVKAIQSYKILSLKYPEKSGFFADQIKAIKELQEQNNNE